jgi:hypothetical protein
MKDLSSRDLFEKLSQKYPSTEFLFFTWSGGGDEFQGYELKRSKNDGIEFENHTKELVEELADILWNSTIFDDLSLKINCVDQGWSEGVLLIALKTLTDNFYHEENCTLQEKVGFKGISVAGKNHESLNESRKF